MSKTRMKGQTMSKSRITRREVLRRGAALLPLAAASQAFSKEQKEQKQQGEPSPCVAVGIATTGFHDYTNQRLAEELKAAHVHTVQLFLTQSDSNYWKYNGRNDLSDLTAERSKAIADCYRAAGISIHSMGVYTNLIHPDEAERQANLAYFEAMMNVGRQMGVRTFITEAGHYHPPAPASGYPATGLPYDFREETWKITVATTKELARLAERHDAKVLVEPSFASVFASAKRTRLFLEKIDSPRIRALLDPANLLELNDLEEMFDQLGPWIDCFHAKDRKLHTDRGVPAGQGDIDYPKFVKLAAERAPGAPLIAEYVGGKDYKQALAHLRNAMRKAGVSEA